MGRRADDGRGDLRFREKVRGAFKNHRVRQRGQGTRITAGEQQMVREFQARIWAQLQHGAVCAYCLDPLTPTDFSLDHDQPVQRGGSFTPENIVLCCEACNSYKGALSGAEYRELRVWVTKLPPEVQLDFWQRLRSGGSRFGRRR